MIHGMIFYSCCGWSGARGLLATRRLIAIALGGGLGDCREHELTSFKRYREVDHFAGLFWRFRAEFRHPTFLAMLLGFTAGAALARFAATVILVLVF